MITLSSLINVDPRLFFLKNLSPLHIYKHPSTFIFLLKLFQPPRLLQTSTFINFMNSIAILQSFWICIHKLLNPPLIPKHFFLIPPYFFSEESMAVLSTNSLFMDSWSSSWFITCSFFLKYLSPLHIYFSLKITTASTFIATLHIYQFQNFVTPPRLIQPPHLL